MFLVKTLCRRGKMCEADYWSRLVCLFGEGEYGGLHPWLFLCQIVLLVTKVPSSRCLHDSTFPAKSGKIQPDQQTAWVQLSFHQWRQKFQIITLQLKCIWEDLPGWDKISPLNHTVGIGGRIGLHLCWTGECWPHSHMG